MKFHFDPDLDFQRDAIEAVCDLFLGQETCRTEFTVVRSTEDMQERMFFAQNDLGVGNRLQLLEDEVLANLRKIQIRNGLRPADTIESGDFTVEMETGTGKTYVYLRTLFELNRRFGFTKFVIVVPSVAIKEGVYKSIQMMEDHFRTLYANVPFDYFLYDSAKLGEVRNFATSSNIQIMVVTVGAINKKDVNNLYKDSEKTGGEKPIDLIRSTQPILIVDEPQSVDGGLSGKGKEALDAMNPLCTLRYSATHADKHHMVFRLDAVDAYERKLVKQIEVASGQIDGAHNKPYVRLLSVSNKRNSISAKVELDVQQGGSVVRREMSVVDGDNLELTTGRALYENYRVGEIRVERGNEFMELHFPGGQEYLRIGQAVGDVDADAVKRQMIHRTIKEHLDKEKRLAPLGIKVLSLFFIDHVDRYRVYDEDGNPVKGRYAQIFEEEYRKLAKHPDFSSLFKEVDVESDAEEVHEGYFSIDKKGKSVDTEEGNQTGRDNAERAYNLIMREKEKLVSFDTKLKFIFSHSALKEGWDNPNVFQICALRDMGTERERRQTIGRGLRLCRNQEGEQIKGFEVNTLTVVAMENYERFAEKLQKEIEEDTGIRFGVVERHQFIGVSTTDADGNLQPLPVESSEAIWDHLKQAGYINAQGKVQDELRRAIKEGSLSLPEEFEAQRDQITGILRKLAGRIEVKNADDKEPIKPRRAVLDSPEFQALWDRIKHKTTYRVEFDNEQLLKECTKALKDSPPINRTKLQWHKAGLTIGKSGVEATETSVSGPVALDESDIPLPDLVTDLQDKTQLTRRSIVKILRDSGRLDDFLRNPQQFIEQAAEAINRSKRLALVDGIRYRRIGDDDYYAQELFEEQELMGYLKEAVVSERSPYEYVVCDSDVERTFAGQLEKNEAVKVYAKLPGWFKIPTPIGTYNPDWAVVVDVDGKDRIYFVVETKDSLFKDDLRTKEGAKIRCGEKHFEALAVHENPARYQVARTVEDFMPISAS
ncbi:MAG: DEAD/DEAH box helicase family protein [Akkermansiaceae bacterium]|nr:DEAD/DEAH box helicase family protein [Akkermansiaceae bacterium]